MDFNKIKEMGLEYAEKGRNAAMDLAERGRTQAKIVSEQTKLDHRVPHLRTACCGGQKDLPPVRCAGLGRCTVLQQVRRAAVT